MTAFTPQPHSVADLLLVLSCSYPQRNGQAELTWAAGYITTDINVLYRKLNPDTVTHSSTNRARRGLTSLIETNALPLRQTDTLNK